MGWATKNVGLTVILALESLPFGLRLEDFQRRLQALASDHPGLMWHRESSEEESAKLDELLERWEKRPPAAPMGGPLREDLSGAAWVLEVVPTVNLARGKNRSSVRRLDYPGTGRLTLVLSVHGSRCL